MMPTTLKETLEHFKTGNRSAFEYIYKEYAEKVYRFAKKYIMQNQDAEEVVQDVFIRLWYARLSINPELNFDNYLFTITKNLIFNHHRNKVNESYFQTVMSVSLEREHLASENKFIAEDLAQYIDGIIMNLPPKQQEIFNLSRKLFLSYKEIASRMNISEKTVESHIYQALRVIRKQLQRENIR